MQIAFSAVMKYYVKLQVCYNGEMDSAVVTFATHQQAMAAYRCTEPIFNNRFVKVFWHVPEDEVSLVLILIGMVSILWFTYERCLFAWKFAIEDSCDWVDGKGANMNNWYKKWQIIWLISWVNKFNQLVIYKVWKMHRVEIIEWNILLGLNSDLRCVIRLAFNI